MYLLKRQLGVDIYNIVESFLDICHHCGSPQGITCLCWTHLPIQLHPIGEIYDLGRWCQRCHEGLHRAPCLCYRVWQATHCSSCNTRLTITSFSTKICSNTTDNHLTNAIGIYSTGIEYVL
jgi:hypothetical protein